MTTAVLHEDWLARAVGLCGDVMLVEDLDGRVVAWNARAEQVYGWRAEEMLGRPVDVLAVPGWTDAQDAPRPLLERVRTGEVLESVPVRRRTRAGLVVRALLSMSPVYDDGRVAGAVVVLRPDPVVGPAAPEDDAPDVARELDPAARGRAVHQARTARLAAAVARRLGMPEDDVADVRLAASVHDLGSAGVPGAVLTHPGPLSAQAWALVRTHSRLGHDTATALGLPPSVAATILQHHERLDGSGYPYGSTGAEIGTGARVVAVADVTEAVTAPRPYRTARPLGAAMEELLDGRGRLYDRDCVDVCRELFLRDGFSFDDATDETPGAVDAPGVTGTPGTTGDAAPG